MNALTIKTGLLSVSFATRPSLNTLHCKNTRGFTINASLICAIIQAVIKLSLRFRTSSDTREFIQAKNLTPARYAANSSLQDPT